MFLTFRITTRPGPLSSDAPRVLDDSVVRPVESLTTAVGKGLGSDVPIAKDRRQGRKVKAQEESLVSGSLGLKPNLRPSLRLTNLLVER